MFPHNDTNKEIACGHGAEEELLLKCPSYPKSSIDSKQSNDVFIDIEKKNPEIHM